MILAAILLAAAIDSTHGEMQRYKVATPEYHHPERSVRVYLPASYRRPESALRRYPLVLLLHGWPGSDKDWVKKGDADKTADSLMARGRMPGPGGMDMGALMKQAQQMQADMAKAQEKLKDEVVDASAGGGMVKVKVSGDLVVQEIVIDPDATNPHIALRTAEPNL